MKKSAITLTSCFILFFIVMLVISPALCISACFSGLNVWATSLLPALFPFFIFTKLLSELGVVNNLAKTLAPLTKRLYNTSGVSGYVYLMSILSGYPVGAKLTADLYNSGVIDSGQAHRITTFTSTSGPLFILGTVAIGMFNNPKIGYTVLIAHFLGALINGLIYRKFMLKPELIYSKPINSSAPLSKNILEDTMLSSIKSILIVGGYVSLFFMIITILNNYHILDPINFVLSKMLPFVNKDLISATTNGFIELTKGCLDISALHLSPKLTTPIISGLVSFGGISIFLQAVTFLKSFKIKLKFYFLQKITHATISVLIALILCTFMF